MTEQEAETKWCPFVRFADAASNASFNRGDIDPMNGPDDGTGFTPRCIGSACMAWRWGPSVTEYGSDPIGEDANHLAFKPSDEGWEFGKITRRWVRSTPNGFCGLAGKP